MFLSTITIVREGFGLASHLGVLSGIPCVGVGKKLFHVDGLEGGPNHKARVSDTAFLGLIDTYMLDIRYTW